MKALIISDDESIVSPVDCYLRDNQFDTIIYKWMIKAIDNIEEIKPDLIVISAAEYPRHWKTLVQFVKSGIGGQNVKIFLYEPSPLNEEDVKKAEQLQVSYFNSLSNLELKKLTQAFYPEGSILFNHPVSDAVYSAQLVRRIDSRLQFKTDFNVPSLKMMDYISHLTLCTENNCELLKGSIISIQNNFVTLDLQD